MHFVIISSMLLNNFLLNNLLKTMKKTLIFQPVILMMLRLFSIPSQHFYYELENYQALLW